MEEQSGAATAASITKKDLLVPVSIILAGGLVGLGLYFGGGGATAPTAATGEGQQLAAAPQETTSTENIDPVTEDDHIKGSVDAPVKIVEYSDFDCPFCSRFHDTMNEVVAEDSEVAWVFRQFPLEQLHPQAPAVAAASECVARLGGNDAFWSFTDGYFAARGSGDRTAHATLIPSLVSATGVDQAAFSSCFENGETRSNVEADLNNAVATGGRGTPWSVIIGPSGKTYPVNGALPAAAVRQLIETAKNEA